LFASFVSASKEVDYHGRKVSSSRQGVYPRQDLPQVQGAQPGRRKNMPQMQLSQPARQESQEKGKSLSFFPGFFFLFFKFFFLLLKCREGDVFDFPLFFFLVEVFP